MTDDPASYGGPSGTTGAPSSGGFDWNSLATTVGGIVHSLGDIFHTAPDVHTSLPGGYTAPPPPPGPSTSEPPPPASTSGPAWAGELFDFSTPTPYVAAGALVLIIAAINAASSSGARK